YLIEAFGINTEELNDKFQKFMKNEFSKAVQKSEGKSSLEISPIKITKSYLEIFTLQEIAAMAATGVFEKFDSFVKSSLEFISQNIEDEIKTDFDMTLN